MDAELGLSFLEVAYPIIASAALAASRAMGLVLITPAFNRLGLTGMIRSCVAVAIAIPMTFPIYIALTTQPDYSGFFLAGLMVKELLIGLTVGLLFGGEEFRDRHTSCAGSADDLGLDHHVALVAGTLPLHDPRHTVGQEAPGFP